MLADSLAPLTPFGAYQKEGFARSRWLWLKGTPLQDIPDILYPLPIWCISMYIPLIDSQFMKIGFLEKTNTAPRMFPSSLILTDIPEHASIRPTSIHALCIEECYAKNDI